MLFQEIFLLLILISPSFFFVGSVLLIVLITMYNFIKRKKDVLNYRTLVVFSDLSLVKVNTYFMC